MSVGAGSIKRAARTANAGTKAALVTGAEADVMEAVAGEQEKNIEVTDEVTVDREGKAVEAAGSRKGKSGKAAADEKEKTAKKSKEASGKSAVQASEKSGKQKKVSVPKTGAEAADASVSENAVHESAVSESTDTYEAYGIGQQLPVYLL